MPPSYDFAWLAAFLADRAAPAAERVGEDGVLRAVRLGGPEGQPVVIAVRPRPDAAAPRWLAVQAWTAEEAGQPGSGRRHRRAKTGAVASGDHPAVTRKTVAATIRRLVGRMFDLSTDLAPFLAMAATDRILAPLVARRPGLRLPQLPDAFEGAVRAVIGQQVSVAGARTVVDRFIRRFGEAAPGDLGLMAFPAPAAVAEATLDDVCPLGLTRVKARALIAIAAATRDGALSWEALRRLPPEEAQAALTALPGIGPWTASYVRMRALGDRDAFPAADLGVIKALARHGCASAEIAALAESWRPWRGYATVHLWRSLGS